MLGQPIDLPRGCTEHSRPTCNAYNTPPPKTAKLQPGPHVSAQGSVKAGESIENFEKVRRSSDRISALGFEEVREAAWLIGLPHSMAPIVQ